VLAVGHAERPVEWLTLIGRLHGLTVAVGAARPETLLFLSRGTIGGSQNTIIGHFGDGTGA